MLALDFSIFTIQHVHLLLIKREMDPRLVETLPETGVIVVQDGIPVAAGFLRRIEGNMGMLDSYITNPEVEKSVRQEALMRVTETLMKMSNQMKISKLIAFSAYESIVQNLQNNQMKLESFKFLSKDSQ